MNPARRLHDTLLVWINEHGTSQKAVGSVRRLGSEAGQDDLFTALHDLYLVEVGLDDLEERGVKVRVYRRYVKDWRNMVISFPHGWNSSVGGHEVYSIAAMDQLDTLADWFDDRRPSPTSEQKASLNSITSDAQSILDADDSLSLGLRSYIGKLLREIRNALDDELLDERFDYETAAQRLWVALIAAADQSTDPKQKPRWKDAMTRFVWDASASALGSAPSILLALTGVGAATQ